MASSYFQDDSGIITVLQKAPELVIDKAIEAGQWEEARQWIKAGRQLVPDAAVFDRFASSAQFRCHYNEGLSSFKAHQFEKAVACAQAAQDIAVAEADKAKAKQLFTRSSYEKAMALARESKKNHGYDNQFDEAINALDRIPKDAAALQLATDARDKILADPHYFGKHFKIKNTISAPERMLMSIAFSVDGQEIIGYISGSPSIARVWNVRTGKETGSVEIERNSRLAGYQLSSLIDVPKKDSSYASYKRRAEQSTTQYAFTDLLTGQSLPAMTLDVAFAGPDVFCSPSPRLAVLASPSDEHPFVPDRRFA